MAGSEESPAQPSEKPAGPKIKSFSCPKCGGSVTVRTPGLAMSAVCSFCASVIDVTDSNYRILHEYHKRTKVFDSIIPFGTRGKLKGRTWEVIGFVVRMDEASKYNWDEFLLFNPFYGYRWLTANGGHWSFITPLKKRPKQVLDPISYTPKSVVLEGSAYKLFYSGKACVLYCLGEFYWRIKVGDFVKMQDFICPPFMMSSEGERRELTWSKSEYLDAAEVQQAFNIPKTLMPVQQGIASNQPTKWSRLGRL